MGGIWLLLVALLFRASAAGSAATADGPGAGQGAGIRVWVITMGPGSLVYERFGHNAIWVNDPVTGISRVYNYGIFDFAQKNFLLRFIQGRMLYRMEAANPEEELAFYRMTDRSVWLQELNLPPNAATDLLRFLEWNRLPENRDYLYNYYTDNCSTRVRDVLDRVLGGELRRQMSQAETGTTYRWHTRRISACSLPLYIALDVVLGPFVDQPLSAWQEGFLPMQLREHLRHITLRDAEGHEVPLVKRELQWHQSLAFASRDDAPHWLAQFLAAGLLLGGAMAVLGGLAGRSRGARIGFALLASAWTLLVGAAGTFLAGAWLLTDHVAVYGNENLLQCSPLALPLVVLVPLLVLGRRRAARPALWLAVAAAASALLGLVLKALSALNQANGEVIAWILPAQLGLVAGIWLLLRGQGDWRQPPAPASECTARGKAADNRKTRTNPGVT